MTTRRPQPGTFEAAVADAVDVLHARIKPLQNAIVASVPLLADAYLVEVGKLFRAAEQQRHVNAEVRDGAEMR